MNDYLVYLNFPAVPEELLEPIDIIINKPPVLSSPVKSTYHYFQTRHPSNELTVWAQDTFKTLCYPQYQIIREGIDIHRDKGRKVAFNYLIDTGGTAVSTCIYDDGYNLICSESIPLKTWHRLKTDVLHDVRGMTTDRVALSIEFKEYKWGDPFNI